MATLTHDTTGESFRDYTLKLQDADRIRIEANGEYVTYMRLLNGELSYVGTEKVVVI